MSCLRGAQAQKQSEHSELTAKSLLQRRVSKHKLCCVKGMQGGFWVFHPSKQNVNRPKACIYLSYVDVAIMVSRRYLSYACLFGMSLLSVLLGNSSRWRGRSLRMSRVPAFGHLAGNSCGVAGWGGRWKVGVCGVVGCFEHALAQHPFTSLPRITPAHVLSFFPF